MSLAKISAAIAIALSLAAPARAAGSVVILDYHSFLGNGKSNIDYSEKELASELDEIAAMGYRFVSLEDAIAGRIEGSANVVVTIDDGNHSVYRAYEDVLKPRGIKPYLFVYPAIILHRSRYALSEEQLKELEREGCGVGAHGYYHNPVSDKAFIRNRRSFQTEILKPGAALETILGARPTLFAYPFGVYSREAEAEIAEAGYAWAFAADDQVRQVAFDDPRLNRMAVPRTITYRYLRKARIKALKAILEAGRMGEATAG
jgi:poly-beta-1,6-N-acetyl-D-glucosamine N-deacetylase